MEFFVLLNFFRIDAGECQSGILSACDVSLIDLHYVLKYQLDE